MPKLRCNADTCMHNNNNCCCRGEITVSGQQADTSKETCCSNFYEQTGSASNAVSQEVTEFMDVQCQAQNCTHNKDCKCCADSIDVSGHHACNCDETCCSSFVPE